MGALAVRTPQISPGVEAQKNGRPNIVPLSSQVVEALRARQPFAGHSRYCFPGGRTDIRPISDNTLNAALRTLGFSPEQATTHGFRAIARTVLDEILEEPIHVIEAQLAHKVRDALSNAYNRTSHIEQRRKIMQRWANYLDAIAEGGNVIAITPKAA